MRQDKQVVIVAETSGAGERGGAKTGAIVAVAVLTYKRPDLLKMFLDGYEAMERPSGYRLILIVVDNDADASARAQVEAQNDQLGTVHYVVEARRGIPVARNRALDEALALDADFLCFIDDDETPDPQWIVRLLKCQKQTGAQLIGGPVEVAAPPAGASSWQARINESLAARMRRKNRRTAQRAARGGRYTAVTNNWLCDLNWQRRTGLRFDEELLVTGGSDTAFFRAARVADAVTGWCADALVYETMTTDRLSLIYQFKRGASQSNNHFRMKRPTVGLPLALATIILAVVRFVLGLVLLVAPIYGRASLVMAVRSLGWSLGRLQAVFGARRSTLYE